MADLSPNELLHWLVQNQFLSEARAEPLRSPPAKYADVMALAKELMDRNWLTPYQLNQILQGKGDGLVLGPYRLLERIGEGAMGQVYKAWNPKLEQLVAIKMIHKEHLASKKAMDRFRREMETAGQLEHPNIVRLRDADEFDSRPFMVMNFIDGTDLSRLVKQDGPLPIWQAAEYARQTALGIQHAFERGVVHRDIKPGNLLVTRDANPVVKISDFGLARFETERESANRLTQIGSVLGTVDYIAPEQAENAQNADVRSDIYSLGCSLYFLLTGKPPYPGSTLVEKISNRMTGDPIDIRTYRPEVPAGLVAILKRMTARRPADRYQGPLDVANALQPFCVKDPPLAMPVPGGSAPLARPVTLAAPRAKDPFSFSASDAGAAHAVPTAAPPAPPATAPAASKKKPLALYALGGGGIVVIFLLAWLLRGCGSVILQDVYPPDAALEITLKEAGKIMKAGERKFLIFEVKRTKFAGKVEVTLEKLPDGVQAEKTVLEPNKKQGQIPITVSFGTASGYRQMRAKAVAKNLAADASFALTIIGPEDPAPMPEPKQ